MTFFDLFRYGCINLWRRKSRTVLTALSMTIGVMCIIVLISVGLGYEASYRESIEQLGSLTKIDVTPADQTLLDKTALLNEKAVNAFKNIEGVEAVTPVVQKSAYIKCGNFVNMVRIYGIDVSTAASFQLEPERGEAPGEGTRLHPDVMFTDDVAATFSDAKNDWAAAVDADGNALIDPLAANIKLTFDYSNLSGEQRADGDGRALPMGNFYTLNVTGVCSTLNNTYSTSAFMDFDRLNELIDANADYLGARKDEKLLAEEKKNGPHSVSPDTGHAGRNRCGGDARERDMRSKYDDDVHNRAHEGDRHTEGHRHLAWQHLWHVFDRGADIGHIGRHIRPWPKLYCAEASARTV